MLATWIKLVDLDERSRDGRGRVTDAILRRGADAIENCEEAFRLTFRLALRNNAIAGDAERDLRVA
ncbi:hypothetical protein ABEG18_05990 [Alsobacter sp. KACC 23698]|uniref:Uncharacterized protein n=1 Tax=Alsobacter sp. KACC 23698 TaxID=3149229 RepID=A0AAU7JJ83_9HYPH